MAVVVAELQLCHARAQNMILCLLDDGPQTEKMFSHRCRHVYNEDAEPARTVFTVDQ